MIKYSTSDFKNGLKIIFKNDPYTIINHEFVKPGKGQAFTRIKIRNLLNGKVLEKTYKSGEKVIAANIQETTFNFLYQEGETWHFMDPVSYEQIDIPQTTVADAKQWLIEDASCQILFWNEQPIAVTPENFVTLTIAECEPGVRGDTVNNTTKLAIIETGAQIRVPLFINHGEKIKIDTRTGEYISRG